MFVFVARYFCADLNTHTHKTFIPPDKTHARVTFAEETKISFA